MTQRPVRAALAAAVTLLLLPTAAEAGQLQLFDGNLVYFAGQGESNELELHATSATEVKVIERDETATLTSEVCTPVADEKAFTCAATPMIQIRLGDGVDSFDGSTLPSSRRLQIVGGEGGDQITAGAADDVIYDVEVVPSADTFDGGGGRDLLLAYANRYSDNMIDLNGGAVSGTADEGDTIVNFESAVGGSGNDTLLGNGSGNELLGGDGNDTISGGGGGDSALGQRGTDTISGGAGNDELRGGDGADTINSGDDSSTRDQVGCGADTDTVNGDGADAIEADCETINGGAALAPNGTGPAGPAGPTGQTGQTGQAGQTGQPGPQGATGPQGPRGTVTCRGATTKPKVRGRRVSIRVICKLKASTATRSSVRLVRNGRTVARGSIRRGRMSLSARRKLARGAHTLVIGKLRQRVVVK